MWFYMGTGWGPLETPRNPVHSPTLRTPDPSDPYTPDPTRTRGGLSRVGDKDESPGVGPRPGHTEGCGGWADGGECSNPVNCTGKRK